MSTQKPPPNYRWNFTAFVVDYVTFSIATTFASFSSVLPALVRELTDSAPVVGLVTTAFRFGWLLPQLAVGHLVSDKPHKKPYMLLGAIGRVTIWITALALWAGLVRFPTAMLILLFTCLVLFGASDGFASVPWFDIMARAIPVSRRGRMLGTAQLIIGLVGMGVGALVGLILERLPFPRNYALIFTFASLFLIPTTIALALIREPEPERSNPQAEARRRRGSLSLLKGDTGLRRLVACRLLMGVLALATPFYVGHAIDVLHLPPYVVGSFVAAQALAGVIASPVLGLVSERWGPRYVIHIGNAAAAVGPLFALAVQVVGGGLLARAYPLVYVAMGIANGTLMLGFTNYLMEMAPDGLRPAYIGLSNTLTSVTTFIPVVGGWLLEATSYPTLFGLTATVMAVNLLIGLRLRPARASAPGGETA